MGVKPFGSTSEVLRVVTIHQGDVQLSTWLDSVWGDGGGGVFSIRTSKGNAELQTGSVFVYPTQAHSGSTPLRTANAQTDANHMTGHAELQRAPPETVCVYVCVTVNMCVVQLLCGKTKCVIQ